METVLEEMISSLWPPFRFLVDLFAVFGLFSFVRCVWAFLKAADDAERTGAEAKNRGRS